MPDKVIEQLALLMYALAAISGGLGGCAMASSHVLRGKPARAAYILAYGMVGVVFGVLTLAWGANFGVDTRSIDSVIGNSILVGGAGSLALASTNISARWVLKRLGIEVEVSVKRREEK